MEIEKWGTTWKNTHSPVTDVTILSPHLEKSTLNPTSSKCQKRSPMACTLYCRNLFGRLDVSGPSEPSLINDSMSIRYFYWNPLNFLWWYLKLVELIPKCLLRITVSFLINISSFPSWQLKLSCSYSSYPEPDFKGQQRFVILLVVCLTSGILNLCKPKYNSRPHSIDVMPKYEDII